MIKNIRIIFNLDSCFWIELESEDTIKNADCRDESTIFLYGDGFKKCILNEDTVRENLLSLESLLFKAINNNVPLHSSIKNNIGYLHNEASTDFLPCELRDRLLWDEDIVSDEYVFKKMTKLNIKFLRDVIIG